MPFPIWNFKMISKVSEPAKHTKMQIYFLRPKYITSWLLMAELSARLMQFWEAKRYDSKESATWPLCWVERGFVSDSLSLTKFGFSVFAFGTQSNKIKGNSGAVPEWLQAWGTWSMYLTCEVIGAPDYNRRLNLRFKDSRKEVKPMKLMKRKEQSALGGVNNQDNRQ